MFENLNIVVGITGGIAAYKACGYEAKGKLPKNEEIINYIEVLVKEKR